MTSSPDPFDALRVTDEPRSPRPEFADYLRRQVANALAEPIPDTDPPTGVQPMPSDLFYFTLPAPELDKSKAFFGELLGWQVGGGSLGGHIESTTQPGGLAPGGSEPAVYLRVDDLDDTVQRVEAGGGQVVSQDVYETGKSAECVDPSGIGFRLQEPAGDFDHPSEYGRNHGDLFYFSIPAPDAEVSMRFYEGVLGWSYDEPGEQGGIHVANSTSECGLGGGREAGPVELFFRVDDIGAAAETVADLGGSVLTDVMEGDEGKHLVCTDDQGITFGLSEPSAGY